MANVNFWMHESTIAVKYRQRRAQMMARNIPHSLANHLGKVASRFARQAWQRMAENGREWQRMAENGTEYLLTD